MKRYNFENLSQYLCTGSYKYLSDGPCGLVLPFKFMTPAENPGSFNYKYDGDEPEIGFLQGDGETAEQDNGCPNETESS